MSIKMFKRNVALQKLINDHKTIATFKKQITYKKPIYLLHLICSEMRHSYDPHPRLRSNAY